MNQRAALPTPLVDSAGAMRIEGIPGRSKVPDTLMLVALAAVALVALVAVG